MAKKSKTRYVSESIKSMYKRERSRVINLINRYRKAGYDVKISAPKIPKVVNKGSIRNLQKITPKVLSEKSYTPHPETGEMITARHFRNINRRLPKSERLKPFQQKNVSRETFGFYTLPDEPVFSFETAVIDGFIDLINTYWGGIKDIYFNWLEKMRNLHGDTKVAEMLEDARFRGLLLEPEELYKEGDKSQNIRDITELMDISAAEKNLILRYTFESDDILDEIY